MNGGSQAPEGLRATLRHPVVSRMAQHEAAGNLGTMPRPPGCELCEVDRTRMTDTSEEPRFRGWGPRFLGHGVDSNDFARVMADIEVWAQWHDAWVETATQYEIVGDAAEALGRTATSGDAFARAGLLYHYAKFVWAEDPDQYRVTCDRSIAALQKGMQLLDPTFERWVVPFESGHLAANIRRPRDSREPPPTVVLVPGLDSTKEEFRVWEDVFLQRGMATISLDGPGQGEGGYANRVRPDYEVPVSALLDSLEARSDLDMDRVGLAGLALGDYYVARAAAFETRVKAIAGIGGAYLMPPQPPALIMRKFKHSAHLEDDAEAETYVKKFTLEGVAPLIRQPYLVISGALDRLNTEELARRKVDEAALGELVIYPNGGVACHTVGHLAKPYLADWMKEKLG
jgi:hypothetical protein